MRIRNMWLGFHLGYQVRIRAIAATYWMWPLIVSPLLVLFLVVCIFRPFIRYDNFLAI
ncbi:hypothetical protein Hanom_Chr09g00850481 [Helianthus anomalus]